MKKGKSNSSFGSNCSRRKFLGNISKTAAGLFLAPYIKLGNVQAYPNFSKNQFIAQVAITSHTNYNRTIIKQKVQHLFDSIGGISDVVGAGDKVAVKINLTGGSYWAGVLANQGVDITESMWTHPEVVRAVCELIIDSGVSANNVILVESLADSQSYDNYGYLTLQQDLGIQMIDLEQSAPYQDFIQIPVPNNYYYSTFQVNEILQETDVYVSIPKMKQHYSAGVTHSLKNQVGMVPKQFYMATPGQGMRGALHTDGGSYLTHLPRSVSDLNLARPVHLVVIDGIKNAIGGEGAWNPTFQPAQFDVLLAGKDPVATDSIASQIMGNNPEGNKLLNPDGQECDNHLELLHQKSVGTNQLSEIEIVGDGAGIVGVETDDNINQPDDYVLAQNFPNPFNAQTIIRFKLPKREFVTIKLYDVKGAEIDTFVEGFVPSGLHELQINTNHLASGLYLYKLQTSKFSDTKKMILSR